MKTTKQKRGAFTFHDELMNRLNSYKQFKVERIDKVWVSKGKPFAAQAKLDANWDVELYLVDYEKGELYCEGTLAEQIMSNNPEAVIIFQN